MARGITNFILCHACLDCECMRDVRNSRYSHLVLFGNYHEPTFNFHFVWALKCQRLVMVFWSLDHV